MPDVTKILSAIERGDPAAADQLLPLVYDELRKMAALKMAQEQPGQTLQATALVHEAYMRLVGTPLSSVPDDGACPNRWNGRAHFFGAAAEAMRRILIEAARSKQRLKRGGDWRRVTVSAEEAVADGPACDVIALDEALAELEREKPEKAQLVKLRYFAGMTLAEAAEALRISSATADRYWKFARAWLAQRLRDTTSD